MTHLMESWPLVVGIFGITLGIVSFFSARLGEEAACGAMYEIAIKETKDSLALAEQVLSSGKLTPNLRLALLITLKMGTSAALARSFFESLNGDEQRHDVNCELAMDLRALGNADPEMGEKYQCAIMGLLLAIPVLHSDKLEAVKVANDGATKPTRVLSQLPSVSMGEQDASSPLPVAAEINAGFAANG